MITIVNYDMGNLGSIQNMLKKIGVASTISSEPSIIATAHKLILPGVGHFERAMENLHTFGLIDALNQKVLVEKTPILGICLGMQAISEVLGGVFVNQNEFMHWRKVEVDILKKGVLFKDFPEKINVGLYHSWKVEGLEEKFITAKSTTGVIMAIESIDEYLFGVQFHPESILTEHGEQVLANFIQFVKNIKSV